MNWTPAPEQLTEDEKQLASLCDWKQENEKAMAIIGYPCDELIEQNRAIKLEIKRRLWRRIS